MSAAHQEGWRVGWMEEEMNESMIMMLGEGKEESGMDGAFYQLWIGL